MGYSVHEFDWYSGPFLKDTCLIREDTCLIRTEVLVFGKKGIFIRRGPLYPRTTLDPWLTFCSVFYQVSVCEQSPMAPELPDCGPSVPAAYRPGD